MSSIKSVSFLVLFTFNTFLSFNSSAQDQSTENKIFSTNSSSVSLNPEKTQTKETNQTPWSFVHAYQAKYAVQSEDETLGHATRKLSQRDNQWVLSTYAKLNKYFITLKSDEQTEFHIKNNKLITDRFYSKTKMTFKKARKMEQNFDWDKGLELGSRGKKKWQLPLEKQVFDRVSHTMQLRADLIEDKKTFVYNVSYKGKLHQYEYVLERTQDISTKMGNLSAVKMVRNKSDDEIFTLWLCPELNYLPIKIAQYEKDKPDVTLLLESLDFHKKEKSETNK